MPSSGYAEPIVVSGSRKTAILFSAGTGIAFAIDGAQTAWPKPTGE
jgi:hypothetical protein